MKPAEVFGIIARSFGLYLFIWGLWNMVSLVIEVIALAAAVLNGDSLDLLTKLYYLVAGAGAMLLGFLLLAKADSLVAWTYRHAGTEESVCRSDRTAVE